MMSFVWRCTDIRWAVPPYFLKVTQPIDSCTVYVTAACSYSCGRTSWRQATTAADGGYQDG